MQVDFQFLNEDTLIKFLYLGPFIMLIYLNNYQHTVYKRMVENREFPKQRFLAFFLSK